MAVIGNPLVAPVSSGGELEIEWVAYGSGTSQDIEDAYDDGKFVVTEVEFSGVPIILPLVSRVSSTSHVFASVDLATVYYAECHSGTWSSGSNEIPIPQLFGVPHALGTASRGSASDYSRSDHVHPMPSASDVGALSTTGDAYRSASIPFGACDNTSTSTAFVATVSGITELRDGVCVWLKNGVTNSASGCTLNINSLGAKPIYKSIKAAEGIGTEFGQNFTELFVYDSTRVTGGCWVMVYGYDSNNTYSNASLGCGYAECSTASATTAKTASLSGYVLSEGGIVAVKFANNVLSFATLNINNNGAKAIYYRGLAITDGVILAKDTATFIYDGSYYHLISIDRDEAPVTSVNGQTGAVTLSIPSTAADVGAIALPSSPSSGQYLMWNGSAWVAQSLPVYNGGVS